VIYISRVLAGIISNVSRSDDEESSFSGGMAYFAISMVLELVFGMLASVIVMWFSRQREFRADAGSAKLVGKEKMIAALERLARGHESELDGTMMAFGINGKRSMTELFMSHPPLEKRIQALRDMQ
jgi:heat shock protein HtpX